VKVMEEDEEAEDRVYDDSDEENEDREAGLA
jgi:hypothetical protein